MVATRAVMPLFKRLSVVSREWLMLPIGYMGRELDGKALLAFEAAERGWGVMLSRKGVRTNPSLPRGVMVERAIAPGLAEKMRSALETGRRVVAWCDEGLVYLDAEEYRRRKVDPAAYDLAEHFFAWGQNHANDVIAAVPGRPDKVKVTGNPRFDLHRPEFRKIYESKVRALRERFGDFILVNTKFSKHNGTYSVEEAVALERRAGVIQTAEDESHLRGWSRFHQVGFDAFRDLVARLRTAFPETPIVIRPHPSEKLEPWFERARALPNVVVEREGSVVPWLLAAAVSIHNNCTTGVEAYLLDRPTISFRPATHPQYDMVLPNALSANAFTAEDTVRLCREALETGACAPNSDEMRAIARHFVANVDGAPSVARIMDVLETLPLPAETLQRSYGSLLRAANAGRKLASRLRSRLRGEVRQGSQSPAEMLRLADVEDLLAGAQSATGRFARVEAVEFTPGTVCIFQRDAR